MAKLCEVLQYHLRQKCHDLVQASAKDPVLLSYSRDTDVTAFWQILVIDADLFAFRCFCEPMVIQQPTPCQL